MGFGKPKKIYEHFGYKADYSDAPPEVQLIMKPYIGKPIPKNRVNSLLSEIEKYAYPQQNKLTVGEQENAIMERLLTGKGTSSDSLYVAGNPTLKKNYSRFIPQNIKDADRTERLANNMKDPKWLNTEIGKLINQKKDMYDDLGKLLQEYDDKDVERTNKLLELYQDKLDIILGIK